MPSSRKKLSRELVSLRNTMGHFVEDSLFWPLSVPTLLSGARTIPLDVYEDGNNLVVKASLPGIKPEDLNIEVRDNILTISGETTMETEQKEEAYFLKERRYGQFIRSVVLPYDVKVDKVEAEFADGILTLTMPKAATTKTKKISLKPKEKASKPESKTEK